jgi:glycosyltransferase involved in cell wall biosynthesis
MRFLLGATATNATVQNIALALHEADALDSYHTSLSKLFGRRRITSVSDEVVHACPLWELPRMLASRLHVDARITDWLWERAEHHLDARCARELLRPEVDAFFGIEHGSLAALQTAQRLGKHGVVGFLSPHHALRERWVDVEYERFPELLTPEKRRLLLLARERDRRRDQEADLADVIHTNSKLTQRSLEDAGFAGKHFVTVPNGAPPTIAEDALPRSTPSAVRFVYAGTLAMHKGVQHLLDAWRMLRPSHAELHLYGGVELPERIFDRCGDNIFLHGRVDQERLWVAYQTGTVLVFPTLYDGFGLVVSEALSRGLPVITTSNAGAAELIDEGATGFVVPPSDASALAERIEWCASHPRQLLEMRPRALAAARQMTWARFRTDLRRQLSIALGASAQELAA